MAHGEFQTGCSPATGQAFPTTQWSMVISAGAAVCPSSTAALEQLCRKYWHPLYAYVRRQGYRAEDAQDLTQEFFMRLLENRYLGKADSQRGRFRSFLIASLRNFLSDEWDRATAAKRGGGRKPLPFDIQGAEDRYQATLADNLTPEKVFEQHWTMAVLEHVLARLSREYAAAGKLVEFDALRQFLWGSRGPASYADVAAEMGTTESAIKLAVYRLRGRYREILRSEIAETVIDEEELDEEIRRLFRSFE